ncbi:MAG: hypothetical protein NTX59_02260 [Elusimicrobia bacterium]|nr:hypothetical protein [Elusimicrobiota bacterium]
MKKISLWALSFFVTVIFALFQRMTGPTYPAKGALVTPTGANISYRLPRSRTIGQNDGAVKIQTDRPLTVSIEWKRYKTSDALTAVSFAASGETLCAFAPDQPPAGKLEYSVYALENGGKTAIGPPKVVARFKGAVPELVLVPHILLMFAFMLFSVRIALSALMNRPILKHAVFFNLFFLILGGFIFGPLTQHYAFGSYWTGIPFGHDLTDSKTLLPLGFWAASAVSALSGGVNLRKWVIAAFLATAAVYFIPHSVLGSELDYSKADNVAPSVISHMAVPAAP